jgi:hypothetical protein
MSDMIRSEPDWDHLTKEEHERYLIRYEFFDEWLGSLARRSGMTLDEYDAMIRGKYADITDEEYYYGDEPSDISPDGEEEFCHPDDDED